MTSNTNLNIYYHEQVLMKMSPEIEWTIDEIEAMTPIERGIYQNIYGTFLDQIKEARKNNKPS